MISMIAAVGQNREIGKGGDLVFHLKKDMRFFRETTTGHTVLMGRKTWESLPKKLPNRVNLVATKHPELVKGGTADPEAIDGANHGSKLTDSTPDGIVTDLSEFLEKPDEDVFVIGGEEVYRQMLPKAGVMYLTEIAKNAEGADRFFPDFAPEEWERVVLIKDEEGGTEFEIVKYTRKTMPDLALESKNLSKESVKGEES